MRVAYAIVYVSNMEQAVAFYRDVFGLPLKFETPGWTEFATEGATLALHAVGGGAAGERDAEHALEAGRWHSGFSVPDLDAFHSRMVEKGVPCVQQPRDVFGARVAQYRDPDGLTISVSESRGGR